MTLKYTTRKFYNKWIYKITLLIPGISYCRYHLHDGKIDLFLDHILPTRFRYATSVKAESNKELIKRFCNHLVNYDKSNYSIRVERDRVDFYSNDRNIYEQLYLEFADISIHRFEPEHGKEVLLESSGSKILAKKYPHDKYQYKVFLQPHKMIFDKILRTNYLNWLDSNQNIKISDAVKAWFINTNWNWDRRYILVADSQTLLMLKLKNPDVIGKIYEYEIVDK